MVGERKLLNHVGDRGFFGHLRLHEFEPRRSVEKQVAHLDSGSRRHPARPLLVDIAAA